MKNAAVAFLKALIQVVSQLTLIVCISLYCPENNILSSFIWFYIEFYI